MRILFFLIFELAISPLIAQKHDYIWVTGHGNQFNHPDFGGTIIDFNNNTVLAYYNHRELNFGSVNSSICDSSGQLLFYTNGCSIAGANDTLLENGDNINPGDLHDKFCYSQYTTGYVSGRQSVLSLPLPHTEREFVVFHIGIENIPHPVFGTLPMATHFYNSNINMTSIEGKGKVETKNHKFFNDTVGFGEMCAIRHANDIDWWVIIPTRYDKNEYYKVLVTTNGTTINPSQSFGFSTLTHYSGGQTQFTPDGKKFIRYRSNEGIYIFDFDRETGILSNMVFVNPSEITLKYGGCAVSPNSRFLYLTNLTKVFQLDLDDPLNPTSFELVGTYDGYSDTLAANFAYCQLCPD